MTTKITMQDIKKMISSPITTHVCSFIAGLLLAYGLTTNAKQARFEDREDNALNTFKNEYVDPMYGRTITSETYNPATFNRAYFDPTTYPTINWTNHPNQTVGEIFGEVVAKEMACGIDSVNHRLTTPGKKYGLDYNYCNKAATTAILDAERRVKLKQRGKIDLFDVKQGRRDAIYNGDSLVAYFSKQYANVPGVIIKNPSVSQLAQVGAGAVVRFPGHSKVYIGIGFVDPSGKVFVPDAHGKPVIASGYSDSFEYFSGENCTVVDLSKIITYKLQNETQRHRR